MIRALIGRFIQHCITKAGDRAFDKRVRGLDMANLTAEQISDLVHGRPIDMSRPSRQARDAAR